eukprot:364591-Chlamydomonas_euryale.AAC.13
MTRRASLATPQAPRPTSPTRLRRAASTPLPRSTFTTGTSVLASTPGAPHALHLEHKRVARPAAGNRPSRCAAAGCRAADHVASLTQHTHMRTVAVQSQYSRSTVTVQSHVYSRSIVACVQSQYSRMRACAQSRRSSAPPHCVCRSS